MSEINKDIIVRIKNITKKFGDFYAVSNVNIEIHKGEIVGFLGQDAELGQHCEVFPQTHVVALSLQCCLRLCCSELGLAVVAEAVVYGHRWGEGEGFCFD